MKTLFLLPKYGHKYGLHLMYVSSSTSSSISRLMLILIEVHFIPHPLKPFLSVPSIGKVRFFVPNTSRHLTHSLWDWSWLNALWIYGMELGQHAFLRRPPSKRFRLSIVPSWWPGSRSRGLNKFIQRRASEQKYQLYPARLCLDFCSNPGLCPFKSTVVRKGLFRAHQSSSVSIYFQFDKRRKNNKFVFQCQSSRESTKEVSLFPSRTLHWCVNISSI